MNRRSILAAAAATPGIAYAGCGPETPGPSAPTSSGPYVEIPIPDANFVRVRLYDFTPIYPGTNGGRIDMRCSDGSGVDARQGAYSWAFDETYDHHRVSHSASATDHDMSDMVRLCTATLMAPYATAEFELTFTRPHADRWKLWRWSGTTLYLDERVVGYTGFATWRSTAPLRIIRLFPDVGSFTMSHEVEVIG